MHNYIAQMGGVLKSIDKWNKGKNTVAYAVERPVLQETFFKLKIGGL